MERLLLGCKYRARKGSVVTQNQIYSRQCQERPILKLMRLEIKGKAVDLYVVNITYNFNDFKGFVCLSQGIDGSADLTPLG